MEFIVNNWELIVVAMTMIMSLLNVITKHWKDNTGLVKALTFVTEALSILKSANVPGLLKVPGKVSK